MGYIIHTTFVLLLFVLILQSSPQIFDNAPKLKPKLQKLLIETIWCFLSGYLFVLLKELFQHGQGPGRSYILGNQFDIDWIFASYKWDGFNSTDLLNEFIFGFVVCAIIIFTIKIYKKN